MDGIARRTNAAQDYSHRRYLWEVTFLGNSMALTHWPYMASFSALDGIRGSTQQAFRNDVFFRQYCGGRLYPIGGGSRPAILKNIAPSSEFNSRRLTLQWCLAKPFAVRIAADVDTRAKCERRRVHCRSSNCRVALAFTDGVPETLHQFL